MHVVLATLLCVFIVFVETLGIIYVCGPPRKRVGLNIKFGQKKRLFWAACLLVNQLDFVCWLSVTEIFDNFKK